MLPCTRWLRAHFIHCPTTQSPHLKNMIVQLVAITEGHLCRSSSPFMVVGFEVNSQCKVDGSPKICVNLSSVNRRWILNKFYKLDNDGALCRQIISNQSRFKRRTLLKINSSHCVLVLALGVLHKTWIWCWCYQRNFNSTELMYLNPSIGVTKIGIGLQKIVKLIRSFILTRTMNYVPVVDLNLYPNLSRYLELPSVNPDPTSDKNCFMV